MTTWQFHECSVKIFKLPDVQIALYLGMVVAKKQIFFSFFKFGSVPLNLPLHSGLRRKNVKKHLASVLMTQCARIYLSSLMFIFVKNIWVCVT